MGARCGRGRGRWASRGESRPATAGVDLGRDAGRQRQGDRRRRPLAPPRAAESSPRHLPSSLSVAVEAGLADRLIGTFTAFYYALLSGRRFEILSYGDLPPLDAALEPGRVDWRRQTPLGDAVLDPLKFTYKGLRGNTEPRAYGPEIDPSKFFPVYAINKDDVVDDLLLAGDVASKPAGGAAAETVVIATNRGRVFRLFDNPHHRAWLLDHGLQPELCIACSFHYLFKARPEVEAMFATAFTALSDPAPLKIGVNVRAGDQVWRGVDSTPWEVAEVREGEGAGGGKRARRGSPDSLRGGELGDPRRTSPPPKPPPRCRRQQERRPPTHPVPSPPLPSPTLIAPPRSRRRARSRARP